MGEYIKFLRESQEISQEELGKRLNPPIYRSAVAKWENGKVENIKRSYILQLALIFNVTPAHLMCFEEPSSSEKALEAVKDAFDNQACDVLKMYLQLNKIGQERIKEALETLIQLEKYQKKDSKDKVI